MSSGVNGLLPGKLFWKHAFLLLPENELAFTAVMQLGSDCADSTSIVTVHGPPGVGKSHLVRHLLKSWPAAGGTLELANSPRTQNPTLVKQAVKGTTESDRLIVTTGSDFAAEFAEASLAGEIAKFQAKYRTRVRLFVCEDVQALEGRRETQQQLVAALDDLLNRGGKVLLTSNRSPGDWQAISPRLVNRCLGGVTVAVDPPGQASRHRLLTHFSSCTTTLLAPETLAWLSGEKIGRTASASRLPSSPRELFGVILLLKANTSRSRKPISLETARNLLAGSVQKSPLTIAEIAKQVARTFEVTLAELRSPTRRQAVVLPRQVAMFLARKSLGGRYVQIGTYFGERNHTTVLHACDRITKLLASDAELACRLSHIEEQLRRH